MSDPRKAQTEPYIDVHAASSIVRLKVGTIYQKTSKGTIPYWKERGYGVLFLRSELEAWMDGKLKGGFRGNVPAGALVA